MINLDGVPSHVVPPRKRATNQGIGLEPVESRPSSQRSSKMKAIKQKYSEVKEEMRAMNKDLSRHVLQTMLNPYDGFDNDN